MAEITAAQVHDLLIGTHEYLTTGETAAHARDDLGHLFLDVARQAKVGLRELSAISGLHHSTIRAMINHAAGPVLPDGWEQPELPIPADLGRPAGSGETRNCPQVVVSTAGLKPLRPELSGWSAAKVSSASLPVMSL